MIWVSGVNEFERPDGIGKVSNGNTDLSATDFSVFERPDGIGKVSNSLLANDFLPLPPFEGMAGIVRV